LIYREDSIIIGLKNSLRGRITLAKYYVIIVEKIIL
jgi:hypothetical protein